MRRAARTDAPQAGIVRALRRYGCKVAILSAAGVPGLPDILVCAPNSHRLGLIEIKDGSKSPSKRALTDDQVKFWADWEGAPIALVTDIDAALRFARQLAFG